MALVVEDGTGLPNAESYVSVADADEYHSNRGNSAWAALDTPAKEAALRKATEYIDGTYYGRWSGKVVSADQALAWPRQYVYVDCNEIASDIVPNAVIRATCYAALQSGEGVDLTEPLEHGGKVKRTLDQVSEGVKEEREYFSGSSSKTVYTAIDNYLRPLLGNNTVGSLEVYRS